MGRGERERVFVFAGGGAFLVGWSRRGVGVVVVVVGRKGARIGKMPPYMRTSPDISSMIDRTMRHAQNAAAQREGNTPPMHKVSEVWLGCFRQTVHKTARMQHFFLLCVLLQFK